VVLWSWRALPALGRSCAASTARPSGRRGRVESPAPVRLQAGVRYGRKARSHAQSIPVGCWQIDGETSRMEHVDAVGDHSHRAEARRPGAMPPTSSSI
jgi:hypothetical protein